MVDTDGCPEKPPAPDVAPDPSQALGALEQGLTERLETVEQRLAGRIDGLELAQAKLGEQHASQEGRLQRDIQAKLDAFGAAQSKLMADLGRVFQQNGKALQGGGGEETAPAPSRWLSLLLQWIFVLCCVLAPAGLVVFASKVAEDDPGRGADPVRAVLVAGGVWIGLLTAVLKYASGTIRTARAARPPRELPGLLGMIAGREKEYEFFFAILGFSAVGLLPAGIRTLSDLDAARETRALRVQESAKAVLDETNHYRAALATTHTRCTGGASNGGAKPDSACWAGLQDINDAYLDVSWHGVYALDALKRLCDKTPAQCALADPRSTGTWSAVDQICCNALLVGKPFTQCTVGRDNVDMVDFDYRLWTMAFGAGALNGPPTVPLAINRANAAEVFYHNGRMLSCAATLVSVRDDLHRPAQPAASGELHRAEDGGPICQEATPRMLLGLSSTDQSDLSRADRLKKLYEPVSEEMEKARWSTPFRMLEGLKAYPADLSDQFLVFAPMDQLAYALRCPNRPESYTAQRAGWDTTPAVVATGFALNTIEDHKVWTLTTAQREDLLGALTHVPAYPESCWRLAPVPERAGWLVLITNPNKHNDVFLTVFAADRGAAAREVLLSAWGLNSDAELQTPCYSKAPGSSTSAGPPPAQPVSSP